MGATALYVFEWAPGMDVESLCEKLASCVSTVRWWSGEVVYVGCECPPDRKTLVASILAGALLRDWLYRQLVVRVQQSEPAWTGDEIEYTVLIQLHDLRVAKARFAGFDLDTWETKVASDLCAWMEHENWLSLPAFARFRMRPLVTALSAEVERRMRQLRLEDEYEESLRMLRYMLHEQPIVQRELHVFCAPERIWMTDAEGELVRDEEVLAAALADESDVDSEDLAMSILITRSPCRIVLHDLYPEAPWPSFAETIRRVFRERVTPCLGCIACRLHEAQRLRGDDGALDLTWSDGTAEGQGLDI
ncbi:hypothetical protein GCM10025858_08730 [Alicyclobacillus sacchari]|nr:hypothetical protein GCM10025858_08730 [Alicyclobacillus sacchari]